MASPTIETLQAQLHSARKSILFMETQHANTLKGLHAEIQNLQKKCSELTFQTAMGSELIDSDTKTDEIEHLKADVFELTKEKINFVHQLEEKDRQFVELENNALSQEKKYLNELKVKNHKITALANELDNRANTIGYLTTQLHQAKSKLHSLTKQHQVLAPSPPTKPRPSSGHRSSKSLEANFTSSSLSFQKMKESRRMSSSSKESNSRPSSASSSKGIRSESGVRGDNPIDVKPPVRFNPSPMPDPTPFLHAGENAIVRGARIPRPPSVLPPIHRPNSANMLKDSNGNPSHEVESKSSPQFYDSHNAMGSQTKYRETEQIAVRRLRSRISPERELQEGSIRHY